MNLISIEYLVFILLISLINRILPKKIKKYFLCLASILFLYLLGLNNFIYSIIFILIIYLLGLLSFNKTTLFVSILISLVPLIITKYVHSIEIPIIAISFVVFRAISYLVYCYKEKERINIIDYLLYMLFFPGYLSGPIEKTKEFINKINEQNNISWSNFIEGLLKISFGLFMKLIIVENVRPVLTFIFDRYYIYKSLCLLGLVLYSLYIYCDFASYSYIAIGSGKLLGFDMVENFRQPYLSSGVKEFWNRWHMSLNKWFTEYVYIPLGGGKKGKIRKWINMLIVFILSGLWHGDGLGFLIWGLLNGIFVILDDMTINIRNKIWSFIKLDKTFVPKIFRIPITFVLITFTWLFFYLGFDKAIEIIPFLFKKSNISLYTMIEALFKNEVILRYEAYIVVAAIVVLIIIDIISSFKINVSKLISSKLPIIRVLIIAVLVVITIIFGKYGPEYNAIDFVYQRF